MSSKAWATVLRLAGREGLVVSVADQRSPLPELRHRVRERWRVVEPGLVVSILFGSVMAPRPALAQNARDVPLGGRTATMGGAGIAAGNDSAMPYLNPAGIAGVPGDVLAISASIHAYSTREVTSPFAPRGFASLFGRVTDRQDRVESSGGFEIPSAVAYFKHLGPADGVHHVVGVALVIPTVQRFTMVGGASARFPELPGSYSESLSLSRTQTDTYLGPTYGLSLGEVRLGASVFGLYRQRSFSGSSAVAIDALGIVGRSKSVQTAEIQAVSLVPVFGAQLEVTRDLWVGASVAVPGVPITGRFDATGVTQQILADPTGAQLLEESTTSVGSVAVRTPLRLGVGVAWDDRRTFSAALDGSMAFATARSLVIDSATTVNASRTGDSTRIFVRDERITADTIQAIGFAGGVEAVVNPGLAVRAGVFLDASTAPHFDDPPVREDLFHVRYDRIGGTLGVGILAGAFDSTIGLAYARGSGKIVVGDATSEDAFLASTFVPVRQPTSEHTLFLVLSGAVTLEEARSQIEKSAPVQRGQSVTRGVVP